MIPAAWGFSFSTNQISAFMPSLTNEDVFSINQDPLVSPGFLAMSNQLVNVYERRCVSNFFAVSIENRNAFATNYTLWFTNLPGVPATCLVRDCWAHTNYLASDSFTIQVDATSAALLRLIPANNAFTNIISINWPATMVVSTSVNGSQAISYAPLDPDVNSYISRAGITNNPSEMLMAAVIVSLGKQHGWWNNWDALYLFRGSTPNSTAQNLVSTNYTISWQTNGMTFGWNGITGDGTNSYGDTHFNPVTAIAPRYSSDSGNFFVYNRTPAPVSASGIEGFIGANLGMKAGLYCNYSSRSFGLFGLNTPIIFDNVNVLIEQDSHDFTGYVLANRYATNAQTIFHNQITGNTTDDSIAIGLPNASFYILGANSGSGMSNPCGCNLSLAGFGAGMTASQWLVFENDMKTAMGILGL
jgi:Alpha galactosidase C-terminal beta sandwich domain